jgi:2-keto-4-pentenoate hydratase
MLVHLLALHVTPANAQERAQAAESAQQVQAVRDQQVKRVYVDRMSIRVTWARRQARQSSSLASICRSSTAGGEARVRPVAQAMYCRAQLCLHGPLSTAGA